MLEAKRYGYGEKIESPCTLVLGAFDGVHIGHRALLAAAKEAGLPVVVTTLLGGKGKSLFTREERAFLFSRAGVSGVYEIDFTEAVKDTSAEAFASELFGNVHAKRVYCGEDFRFGKNASGTPETLEKYAPVTVVKAVQIGGEKVATSVCKQLVEARDFDGLRTLMDDEYFIGGTVEHGREVGRTYGFPTLNLSLPPEKLLPPDGVYGGFVETPKGRFQSILNIGARPTFGVEEKKLEAHLIGFSGDLYGAAVRVIPTVFLRPVSRFASKEALKEQLRKDISTVQGGCK